MNFLAPYVEPIYAAFRIVFGFLFFSHGAQKVFGLFGGQRMTEGLPMIAGWIEVVCGLLILLGLFTTIAAFVASGEMAVAFFMAHVPSGWHPLVNHGEPAVLFCFAFLYMAARGSGRYSVDAARVGTARRV
ncbi:MAG TPA: DoxX family protein [Candidatus Polarisedimenticolaceae bacterium]|nr:DoxX family protein [Candidatus Polarisedimenticolaceae bacterium]